MTVPPAIFALALVLAATSDWELVAPSDPSLPRICAKSEATCAAAVDAIQADPPRWPIERAYVLCRPAPGCFSPASECIAAYNCGDAR